MNGEAWSVLKVILMLQNDAMFMLTVKHFMTYGISLLEEETLL